MSKKVSLGNFDLDEMNGKLATIEDAVVEAKSKEKENRGEPKVKESLWKKIVAVFIIILLLVGVGYAFMSESDVILMPENSVTIIVKDEAGNSINGLRIKLIAEKHYGVDYEEIPDYTLLDVEPGDYLLTFEVIPDGYICDKITDNFTLVEGGKVKLEYKCSKEK